jgi:hypothetical protein
VELAQLVGELVNGGVVGTDSGQPLLQKGNGSANIARNGDLRWYKPTVMGWHGHHHHSRPLTANLPVFRQFVIFPK